MVQPRPVSGFFGVRQTLRTASGIRVSETGYPAGTVLPQHAHDRPHFCLVLDGHYRETVERQTRLRGGRSLSFQPAGVGHGEVHETAGRHLLIQVPAPLVAGLGSAFERPMDLSDDPSVGLASRIHAELRERDPVTSLAVEGMALELLARVVRRQPSRRGARPDWLRGVEDALEECVATPPTMDVLAGLAGVHRVHLARVFRRVHRCTIAEYSRRLRVQRACRRLEGGVESLAELARELGFCDQSHFTRCFRQQTGWTPSAYRARAGKG